MFRRSAYLAGTLFAGLLSIARPAAALDEGNVFHELRPQVANCDVQGLTYDGDEINSGELLLSCREQTQAYRIRAEDGEVLRIIPLPEPAASLAYDGQYLWIGTGFKLPANTTPPRIYKLDPVTGAVQDSFEVTTVPNPILDGLTYLRDPIDPRLFVSADMEDTVHVISPNGTEISTIPTFSASGHANDGNSLFVVHPEINDVAGRGGIDILNFDGTPVRWFYPKEFGLEFLEFFEDATYIGTRLGKHAICVANPVQKTFSHNRTLTLNPGENTLSSVVITPDSRYTLWGTETNPGRIVKVDNRTLTRVGSLTLPPGEIFLTSAVMGCDGRYSYWGTGTTSAKVIQVDNDTLTRVGSITLNPSENYLDAVIIDCQNNKTYWGTDYDEGYVIEVGLEPLRRIRSIRLAGGKRFIQASSKDPYGSVGFFASEEAPIRIGKVQLSTMTETDSISLNGGENFVGNGVATVDPVDNVTLWGTYTMPGVVVKTGNNPFTRLDAITLDPEQYWLEAAATSPLHRFSYFGGCGLPAPSGPVASLAEIHLPTFTQTGILTLTTGEGCIFSGVMSREGRFSYWGTIDEPGKVIKVQHYATGRGGYIQCFEICTNGISPNEIRYAMARRNGRDVELYWPEDPTSQEYGIDREVNSTRASADQSFNPARISTTSGLAYTDAGVAADGNELVLYSVRGRNCNGSGP